jgi:protein-disulfide isomerase
MFLGILAAVAVIGVGAVAWTVLSRGTPTPQTALLANRSAIELSFRDAQGQTKTISGVPISVDATAGARFVRGTADAKVSIVEFSSYGCHVCKDFAQDDEPKVISQLVESNRARFIYRDYPLTGGNDQATNTRASVVAACTHAQDPEGFWKYHAVLFRGFDDWRFTTGPALNDKLLGYSQQLGFDTTAINTCLQDTKDIEAAIAEDIRLADAAQIAGTPAFIVNGYRWGSGRLSVEALTAIVEHFEKNP